MSRLVWPRAINEVTGTAEGKPYSDLSQPGRLDVNGVEWWVCDPYPTWYRWDEGILYTNPAGWAKKEGQ